MSLASLFEALRQQKYILYVPERVYKAHQANLLRGWGISEVEKKEDVFKLLQQHRVNLRIPFMRPERDPGWQMKSFMEEYGDLLTLHDGGDNCPLFPEDVIASDGLWDSFTEHFNLVESLKSRVLTWDNWVYRVRFCPLWAAYKKEDPRWTFGDLLIGTPKKECEEWWAALKANPEYQEWVRLSQQAKDTRRVLRKEYGLTGEYFGHKYNYTRRVTLLVLKKVYPPDQVKRVRRQLEEMLRKDPSEVIRFGLERELVA